MRILITNDDGVHSPGLVCLKKKLSRFGNIEIVAPEREASASSHAITVHQPLRFYSCKLTDGSNGWAVSGTPADCVVLGILKFGMPDLVVSGINPGANLGDDVTYSGTVGAAIEAALYDINSIAVSLIDSEDPDFDSAAEVTAKIIERMDSLPKHFLLNVNVPPDTNGEIMITKLGRRLWSSNVQERIDPRNKPYYWISGIPSEIYDETSDINATNNGYVSVTPIKLDLTDYEKMDLLRREFMD
ncbi:MAG TPA: 5'/3'-nucleotidase SurE [Candidatus Methanofastidiosa archaeon]|nr:5'/3'-nucleotidase SurE [Candidatus Methanofastidiosa archaeon]HPR41635.1 5'/3'-nucleotidase SurE [Candidatus Methanofastidiosa archaeon]